MAKPPPSSSHLYTSNIPSNTDFPHYSLREVVALGCALGWSVSRYIVTSSSAQQVNCTDGLSSLAWCHRYESSVSYMDNLYWKNTEHLSHHNQLKANVRIVPYDTLWQFTNTLVLVKRHIHPMVSNVVYNVHAYTVNLLCRISANS